MGNKGTTPAAPPGAISFTDADLQKCPYAAYRQLRALGTVYQEPDTGFYVVLDNLLCRQIASNSETFRNDTGIMRGRLREEVNRIYEKSGTVPVQGLVTGDGDNHRFQRALVEKVFTLRHVKNMEPYLGQVIDDCIDEFIDLGTADFYRDFAAKVPLTVISDQLGVPREDMDQFRYWTQCSAEGTNPVLDADRELELIAAEVEFNKYLLDKANFFRVQPDDSLLSNLVHSEVDGRRITDGELVAIASIMIIAGNETTTNAMCNAMSRLVKDPQLQNLLRNDPKQIEQFIEETLRYEAPIQALFRQTSTDTEIDGVSIRAGSIIVLRWGAANRDPKIFVDPDAFNLDRKDVKKHLTFGYGSHFCLGFHLAKSELRISIDRILARLCNICSASSESDFPLSATYVVRGFSEQLINFEKLPSSIFDKL